MKDLKENAILEVFDEIDGESLSAGGWRGTDVTQADSFRVGDWLAYPPLNQLRRSHQTVKVTPKVMEVLCVLARLAPRPATRELLMETVWRGRHVGEESLTHAVSELRKALGDDSRRPRYIQTIPKRGYRLLSEDEQAMPTSGAARIGPRPASRRWWSLGALAVVTGLTALLLVGPDPPKGVPAELPVTPLTSLPGSESRPALSPDGERVAFEWRDDLYLTDVGSSSHQALTRGPAIDGGPAWSPDGKSIAFSRQHQGECGVYLLEPDRGEERRVGRCGSGSLPGISWHPSGSWLAISDSSAPVGRYEIHVLSLDSGKRQPLGPPRGRTEPGGDVEPSFSPDGKRIAFATAGLGSTEIRVVAVAGDPPRASDEPATLLRVEAEIRGLDWISDGQGLVFATGQANQSSMWRLDVDGGEPELIPLGSRRVSQPTVARRADRLVFVERQVEMNLWEGVTERGQGTPVLRPLVASSRIDFNPQLSPDGRLLAFASTRSGDTQIWTSRVDGSDPKRVTRGEWDIAATPAWSPDGRSLAFSVRVRGSFQIHSVVASGGSTRPLVGGPANNADPAYSPDGRWLYFSSDRSGRFEIWRIPAAGGAAEQLTHGGAVAAKSGRGGRYLYHAKLDAPGVWRLDLESRESERLTDLLEPLDWNNWTVSRDGLYLTTRGAGGNAALVFWDFVSGGVVRLFEPTGTIDSDLAGGLTVSSVGPRRLIFAQLDRDESDLYVVDGFR